MFKRSLLTLALLAGLSAPANAATIDFGALGVGNEGSIGSAASRPNPWNLAGLWVDFSASAGDVAYLDGPSGGKPGGLGVCSAVTATFQCNPSSDDNVSANEWVTLKFFYDAALTQQAIVTLSDFVFRDANHNLITSATAVFKFNGGIENFVGFGPETGHSFKFEYANGNNKAKQFYLTAVKANVVPEPATWALMILGFAGLAFARRRNVMA